MNKKFSQRSFNLVQTVNQVLKEKNLIKPNKPLLIGISGGQDSSCLLIILFHIQIQWNLNLNIIYCNHFWQQDSFHVMKNLFNLIFYYNLSGYFILNLKDLKTEQKARIWRYFCYERMSYFYTLNTLITGHTGSDKIETFLFNLLRGTGSNGINSLSWQKYIAFNKMKVFFYNKNCENYKFFYRPKVYISLNQNRISLKEQYFIFIFHYEKIPTHFITAIFEKKFQNIFNVQQIFLKSNKNKYFVFFYLRKFYFNHFIFLKKKIYLKQKLNYKINSNLKCTFKFKNFYKFVLPNNLFLLKLFFNLTQKQKTFYLKKYYQLVNTKQKKKDKFLIPINKALNFKQPIFKLKKIKIFFFKNKSEKISLIRPFLSLNRIDSTKICNFWRIPVYPDKSNQFLNYSRNRIRKQILPTLRFFFNPQIDILFHQYNEIINGEQNFLKKITSQLILESTIKNKKIILFKTSILKFLPIPLQRRIIRDFLENFLNKKIKFYHINVILEIISKNNNQSFRFNNSFTDKILLKKELLKNKTTNLLTSANQFSRQNKIKKKFFNNLDFFEKKFVCYKKYIIFPFLGMIEISSSFIILYKL